MSRANKSAAPETAARAAAVSRLWSRWIFPAGAGLGWALAQLAGALLDGELQPLLRLFIPLSAIAGGCAAVAARRWCTGVAVAARGRSLRAALVTLAAGAALSLSLYLGFAQPIRYGHPPRRFTVLVGTSRSGLCECPADDAACIRKVGLDPTRFRPCWKGVWAVQLSLALSYLLTLGSVGSMTGLLLIPARPQGPEGPPGYLDFDLWIDETSAGVYRAKAWSGAAGFEATESFALPATLGGGEAGYAGSGALRGGASLDGQGGAPPEETGGALFRAVFHGELLKAFQGCLAKAQEGAGLRLRLRLNDVPQLAGLPWETLYDAGGQGFLALSARTPVVRYLELSEGISTLLVEPPLRVLCVIATPEGYRELAAADEEWRRLAAALEPLLRNGLIEVERLQRATPEALEARLRSGPPVHVLHFVGHGGFSALRQEGVLIFEGEDGRGVPVGGRSLAYLFRDHPSLRLAVLNACNGARASDEDTFAGTAQVLVQHGVPAVIAMRSEVMDETACRFAEKFYRTLAAGLPVDACVGEARRSLAAESNPEWGTPALYLRATDGRLFSLAAGDAGG